jgi:hypothetical protein
MANAVLGSVSGATAGKEVKTIIAMTATITPKVALALLQQANPTKEQMRQERIKELAEETKAGSFRANKPLIVRRRWVSERRRGHLERSDRSKHND